MRTCVVLGVIGVGLLLVTGCGQGQKYWYQEGKTFDECKADRAACRTELQKRTEVEHIGDYERQFMETCMKQQGYRLVTEKELPMDVKREGSDMPWEISLAPGYGVAGTLAK